MGTPPDTGVLAGRLSRWAQGATALAGTGSNARSALRLPGADGRDGEETWPLADEFSRQPASVSVGSTPSTRRRNGQNDPARTA
jgi:hypothetical protein